MAYQEIGRYKVYEYKQEEEWDIKQVVNDAGEVVESKTFVQPYIYVWGELVVKQQQNANNTSDIRAELWAHVESGEEGESFIFNPVDPLSYEKKHSYSRIDLNGRIYVNDKDGEQPHVYSEEVAPGSKFSRLVEVFYTDGVEREYTISGGIANYERIAVRHNLDGTFSTVWYYGINETASRIPFQLNTKFEVHLENVLVDGKVENYKYLTGDYYSVEPNILPIDRNVTPITADNFTDEMNASFSYSASNGVSTVQFTTGSFNTPVYVLLDDYIGTLQVALSFDGVTPDIPYRDIQLSETRYTFNFTEEEREILRTKAQGSTSVPIYYLIRTVRNIDKYRINSDYTISAHSMEFVTATQRTLTIVGAYPSMNPTVRDVNSDTLALTGDENTFIRYESMAEYAINATASKNATIVTQSVTCGSKTITDLPYGVIEDVESGDFNFYALDSRNMAVSGSVFKNLIEYVKPTCYQKLEIELSGEVAANVKLTVSGNYYNGSFGAADNTLLLEVRHTDDDGNMGEWTTLTGTPTIKNNTYTLETTFSGFNYGKSYVFQCRATDKLNVVQSSQYTIKFLPTFDWSEEDFNFNVPVNIEADNLEMHGQTIIRHSKDTNNTVLSATNGHIYVRPRGTSNTYGETIFYPDGSIKFGGTVDLGDSFKINGNKLADFVIESGSTSMGSNGTWYWAKWASGKAECWGCRNFGNMAVTTAWGNLYRSAFLTQDLPSKLFVTTPDVININIVNATFGGWICKHENAAPSAVTTGSFIFVRPASATVTAPTYIGFHVIGLWKQ